MATYLSLSHFLGLTEGVPTHTAHLDEKMCVGVASQWQAIIFMGYLVYPPRSLFDSVMERGTFSQCLCCLQQRVLGLLENPGDCSCGVTPHTSWCVHLLLMWPTDALPESPAGFSAFIDWAISHLPLLLTRLPFWPLSIDALPLIPSPMTTYSWLRVSEDMTGCTQLVDK